MNWKVKSLLIQIFWFTAILALCLWLSSCSPQKRLNRIVKNNPELLKKTDTTFIDTVQIVGITYKDSVTIHHDTNWTDSLVIKYNVPRNEAKKILNEASKFKDTLKIDTTITLNKDSVKSNIRVRAKIFQRNGQLVAELDIPSSAVTFERKFSYNKVEVRPLTWWESNRVWLIPLLIAIVGGGIAKKIGLF